jgi:hypothetical protein
VSVFGATPYHIPLKIIVVQIVALLD